MAPQPKDSKMRCIDCGLKLGRLIPTHKGADGAFIFVCLGCWWEKGYAPFFWRAKGETELDQIERLWSEAQRRS